MFLSNIAKCFKHKEVSMFPETSNSSLYLKDLAIFRGKTMLKDYIKDNDLTKNNNQVFLKNISGWFLFTI